MLTLCKFERKVWEELPSFCLSIPPADVARFFEPSASSRSELRRDKGAPV